MKLRVTHFAMLLFIASFAYIGPAYSLTISTFNVSPYDGRKNNKSYTGAWLNIKESRDDNGSIGPFRWGFEFGSDYRKPRSFNIGFSSSRTFLKGGESVRIYDKRNDGDLGNRFWITLSSTYDSTNPKVIDRVSKFYKGLSPANQKVFESTCEILSNSALVSETLDRLSRAVGQSSEYKAFWGQASRKSQLLAAGSLCSAAVAKGGTILKLSRSYIDTYVSKKRYYSNGGVEQLKVAVVTKPAKSAKVVSNQPSVANLCDSLSSIDGEIQPGGTWVEFLLSGSGMQRETLMINLTRSVDSVYKPVNGLPKKLEIRNTRLDNSKGYTRFVAGKLKFYPAGGNDPCELQYVATKDTYKLFKSSDGSDQIVTKAVEEKPDKIKLVFAGLTAQERETVQRGLKDLGFYASNIDGLYGPGTKGAIESYLDLTDPQGVDESLIAGQLRKLISVTEQKIAASRKSVGLVTTGKTEATVADKTERDDERVTEPFEINDEFLLSDVEKFVVGKPEALDAFKLASLYLPAQREVASGTLSSKFQDLKSFVLSNENFVAYAKEQERLREIKYREEIDRNLSFVTTEVEKLRAEIAKAPLSERALQLYSVVEKYSSVTDSSGGEAIISAASALRKDIEGLENNTQSKSSKVQEPEAVAVTPEPKSKNEPELAQASTCENDPALCSFGELCKRSISFATGQLAWDSRPAASRYVEFAKSIGLKCGIPATTTPVVKSAVATVSEKPALKRVDKYKNRKALVIGNADYVGQAPLKNPINDAKAVSKKLEEVGFEVTYRENLGVRDFGRALSDFELSLKGSDISLLYYAGHGIEVEKQNYLIPVDANLRTTGDVRYETVRLDDAVDVALNTGKLSMVLIDACRNNPFAQEMSSRTRSVGRGLSVVEVSNGPVYQILSFAAASGQVAEDGDGENSPYASVLIDLLDEPNLEVGKMFRILGQRVSEVTNGKQQPTRRDNLRGEDIFLVEY